LRAAHRTFALAGGRGPAADPTESGCRLSSWSGGGGPEEPGQLARDGDGGDVAGFAAFAEPAVEAVQAELGAPGGLQDVVGLALLAVLDGGADVGVAGVVPSRFDQQPPRIGRSGLGDRSLVSRLARLGQRRRQPEPAEEPARRLEAVPVATELEVEDERGERVDTAEATQPRDRGPEPFVQRQPRE
jgi:hypothetical protein